MDRLRYTFEYTAEVPYPPWNQLRGRPPPPQNRPAGQALKNLRRVEPSFCGGRQGGGG